MKSARLRPEDVPRPRPQQIEVRAPHLLRKSRGWYAPLPVGSKLGFTSPRIEVTFWCYDHAVNIMKKAGPSGGPNLPALCPFAVMLALLLGALAGYSAPFSIKGPGVKASDFRITVFATNLSYPLGMVQLADGSLLVAVSQGASFWNSSTGQLLRLTDTNHDGIADDSGTVLYNGLPGGQTSLRMCGQLFFVTGQGVGHPISILRAGPNPASPLTFVGTITIIYPSGGWEHPHSGLGIRPTPGQPGSCDLLFQLGSDQNFAKTIRTASLTNAQIPGASGTLKGESIYLLTITDNLTNVVASNLTRLAKGLRNAAGFVFHPVTGDLYFNDNGIDGLTDPNEPLSADEINFIGAGQIGNGTVPD